MARRHKVTQGKRERIFELYGQECFYCSRSLSFGERGNGTFDHLVPLCRGGTNAAENLVPSCHGCNNKKADRKLVYRGGRLRFIHVAETQVPPLGGLLGGSRGAVLVQS